MPDPVADFDPNAFAHAPGGQQSWAAWSTTPDEPGNLPDIVPPEQDPGEGLEARAQADVARVGLSQVEQAYLRQLQYGQQSVQRQMDQGQIRPQQGMAMLQAMWQRAGPLRVRASQLPILMRRLQFVQLQRQMAHQESIFQENANFRARSLADRITTVNGIQFMETRPGQFEPLPAGLQRTTPTRPEVSSTQILDIANRFQRDFREQNSRDATAEETQAHVNQQLDLLRGVMGGGTTTPSRTPGAPSGGAPTRLEAPVATGPSQEVRAGVARTLQTLEMELGGGAGVLTEEGSRIRGNLVADIREARAILGAHRGAIPPDRLERYQQIMARLAEYRPALRGQAGTEPPPPRRSVPVSAEPAPDTSPARATPAGVPDIPYPGSYF